MVPRPRRSVVLERQGGELLSPDGKDCFWKTPPRLSKKRRDEGGAPGGLPDNTASKGFGEVQEQPQEGGPKELSMIRKIVLALIFCIAGAGLAAATSPIRRRADLP